MSRITLITFSEQKELNNLLKNINIEMCKVPYGIDDKNRFKIDNLPFHFTIFSNNFKSFYKVPYSPGIFFATTTKRPSVSW